jgi:hypothetical protein
MQSLLNYIGFPLACQEKNEKIAKKSSLQNKSLKRKEKREFLSNFKKALISLNFSYNIIRSIFMIL